MSPYSTGHPTHIVCPCTYGRPQDCHFAQSSMPRVERDVDRWTRLQQEAFERITPPWPWQTWPVVVPKPRPWRGICPPIGAGQR